MRESERDIPGQRKRERERTHRQRERVEFLLPAIHGLLHQWPSVPVCHHSGQKAFSPCHLRRHKFPIFLQPWHLHFINQHSVQSSKLYVTETHLFIFFSLLLDDIFTSYQQMFFPYHVITCTNAPVLPYCCGKVVVYPSQLTMASFVWSVLFVVVVGKRKQEVV